MPVSHSVLRSRLLSKLVTETSRSPRRRCHLRGVHWFIAVMSSETPVLAASSLSVRGSALRKKGATKAGYHGPRRSGNSYGYLFSRPPKSTEYNVPRL